MGRLGWLRGLSSMAGGAESVSRWRVSYDRVSVEGFPSFRIPGGRFDVGSYLWWGEGESMRGRGGLRLRGVLLGQWLRDRGWRVIGRGLVLGQKCHRRRLVWWVYFFVSDWEGGFGG